MLLFAGLNRPREHLLGQTFRALRGSRAKRSGALAGRRGEHRERAGVSPAGGGGAIGTCQPGRSRCEWHVRNVPGEPPETAWRVRGVPGGAAALEVAHSERLDARARREEPSFEQDATPERVPVGAPERYVSLRTEPASSPNAVLLSPERPRPLIAPAMTMAAPTRSAFGATSLAASSASSSCRIPSSGVATPRCVTMRPVRSPASGGRGVRDAARGRVLRRVESIPGRRLSTARRRSRYRSTA